jgi:hypothetical protein
MKNAKSNHIMNELKNNNGITYLCLAIIGLFLISKNYPLSIKADATNLLKNMQDMKLEAPIIRHESAKLKQIQSDMNQAQSALEREKAKLNASAIASSQELQNLKIAVQIAQSDLQMAVSKLETAKSNRKLLEYRASIEAAQWVEQENQFNLNYSQQQQQYAQSLRDRDYKLAQLQIQFSAIDDKLVLIPVVRSPTKQALLVTV